MAKVKTARDLFYRVDDVMRLLGYSRSKGVYTVVIPKRSAATDEQARDRQMPDITWEAQLEGAVHNVKVKGVLRATLSA